MVRRMAERDDPIPESDIDGSGKASDTAAMRKVHDRALRRFDTVVIPQQELRAQSLEARRFVTIPGAMWEGSWGEQYENSPRPEVDKITKSLEKIETDYRENRLTVDYVPGNQADPETADTLDGMHRADSYHFKAQQARDNAFQEAIRGGFGAWRLTTDHADPYDPDDESQRVNPGKTIVDADQSVFFDGGSKLYDKSDAEWAFIVTADPRAEAEEKWPGCVADWPLALWKYTWDWYTPDIVRTAEYYEVEQVPDDRLTFTQADSGAEQRYFRSEIDAKDIKNLKAQGWKVVSKPIKRRRVHKYILNGSKVLRDCGYIAGSDIPIVPVYFRRDYVDNMERWRGYVGKMMDRQRIYNASVAHVVEAQSLAPYPVPIVADEQMTPTIADQWARGNIDRHPFRTLLSLRDANGQIVSAGPIGMIEPVQVQPATAALLQIASGDLTENDDNADTVKANVSAEAMDLAAARVDAKSGIPLDNMRQSVAREGEIYLGMAREVYFEPGRKVETLSMDGQDGEAELMQPSLDEAGVFRIRNDLTQGKFKVIADVQEATATAQGKTVRQCLAAADVAVKAGDQELAQAYLLTAAQNQQGEGMQDMVAFARNKAIGIGLTKPTKEEQQQLAQAQAAQGQQPPAAAEQALLAQASKDGSLSKLNEAKAVQTLADAHLKTAQADAVGGPEKAPIVPSGLEAASGIADIRAKFAGADLKTAQAEHLRHGMHLNTAVAAHDAHMAQRQQDHVESQPQAAE